MIHFTTLAQYKILKYYWKNNMPFTVDDLLKEKIIHFRLLGKFTLKIMELNWQLLAQGQVNGEMQYIASTSSETEWQSIWQEKRRRNHWKDEDELMDRLQEIIDEYMQRDGP